MQQTGVLRNVVMRPFYCQVIATPSLILQRGLAFRAAGRKGPGNKGDA